MYMRVFWGRRCVGGSDDKISQLHSLSGTGMFLFSPALRSRFNQHTDLEIYILCMQNLVYTGVRACLQLSTRLLMMPARLDYVTRAGSSCGTW